MRIVSNRSWQSMWPLSLALISAACLTGCANSLEEMLARQKAEQLMKPVASVANRPAPAPDLPADIITCLRKSACTVDGKPKPECATADGIVVNYFRSEQEKLACTSALVRWYKKQQRIQAEADRKLSKSDAKKHPRSVETAGKSVPSWP
jgi:hypothetical protein